MPETKPKRQLPLDTPFKLMRLMPRVREVVWGGRWLADELGRPGHPDANLGESWEAYSGSRLEDDFYSGPTLGELWAERKAELFGAKAKPFPQFPLLVKFIDARENLSIQVHPDDALAQSLEGYPFGKTEFWYVLEAAPDAEIIYGLAGDGITRETLQAALAAQDVLPHMGRTPVRKGDVVFIPAGTIHALTAGVVVYELQQESDITYRLYDWGRTDREIHLDKGLAATNLACHSMKVTRPVFAPTNAFDGDDSEAALLAECGYFRSVLLRVGESSAEIPANPDSFSLVTVVAGAGEIGEDNGVNNFYQTRKGDTFFVSAGVPLALEGHGAFSIIVSTLA